MRKAQRPKWPEKTAPKNVQALFSLPKKMQKDDIDSKLKEINERLMALDKETGRDMELQESELSKEIPQFLGYLSANDTFDPQFSKEYLFQYASSYWLSKSQNLRNGTRSKVSTDIFVRIAGVILFSRAELTRPILLICRA